MRLCQCCDNELIESVDLLFPGPWALPRPALVVGFATSTGVAICCEAVEDTFLVELFDRSEATAFGCLFALLLLAVLLPAEMVERLRRATADASLLLLPLLAEKELLGVSTLATTLSVLALFVAYIALMM